MTEILFPFFSSHQRAPHTPRGWNSADFRMTAASVTNFNDDCSIHQFLCRTYWAWRLPISIPETHACPRGLEKARQHICAAAATAATRATTATTASLQPTAHSNEHKHNSARGDPGGIEPGTFQIRGRPGRGRGSWWSWLWWSCGRVVVGWLSGEAKTRRRGTISSSFDLLPKQKHKDRQAIHHQAPFH